jgi:hypothetical protein
MPGRRGPTQNDGMSSKIEFTDPNLIAKVRRFIYDATPDGCRSSDSLSLPPVSPDVAALEHDASNERVRFVLEQPGFLYTTGVYASVLASLWLQNIEGADEAEPQLIWETYNLFHNLAMAAMCGSISSLVNDNIIKFVEEKNV